MVRSESSLGPPLPEASPSLDQVVVLHDIPWREYDALCRAREDVAGPRMAYLDGALEIMSPGQPHEFAKKLIARLLEAYAEEQGLSLNGFGSTTYRKKAKQAGVEPDECYCLGQARQVPDLAIEVVQTSGGIQKLEIYRRLGVAEVWFWARGRFYLYRLTGKQCRQVSQSKLLPDLDLGELATIVGATDASHQTEAVRAYRRKLRQG